MKPVEYANASAEVRAVFDDIMKTRRASDVNNFWKYVANEPRMLAHVWSALKEMMGPGHIDPLTKELIYAAVSMSNNCGYCVASHRAAARTKGATDEMLNELIALVGLAKMTNQLATTYRVPIDAMYQRETEGG